MQGAAGDICILQCDIRRAEKTEYFQSLSELQAEKDDSYVSL